MLHLLCTRLGIIRRCNQSAPGRSGEPSLRPLARAMPKSSKIIKTTTHDPSIVDFLLVESQSDLKAYGHFRELKDALSALLGVSIGSKSWSSFYFLILRVQAISRSTVSCAMNGRSTSHVIFKCKLYSTLYRGSVKDDCVRSASFNEHFVQAVDRISEAAADPKVRYRFSKTRNFIYSSKLEGISITAPKGKSTTLAKLLKKHREH